MGGITLTGACLRFWSLGGKSLWFDEAMLWLIARSGSVAGVIVANARTNSAPPLFAVLLSLMSGLGSSEVMLRLVPAAASVAAIPAVYALSVSLVPCRAAGYLAALLLALAPVQVFYAQQVREYGLCVLLAVLTLLVAARCWRGSSMVWLIALPLVLSVDALSQYGLLFIALPVYALVLKDALVTLRRARWRWIALWLAAHGILLCVCLFVHVSTARHQATFSVPYLDGGYWKAGSWPSFLHLALTNSGDLLKFALVSDDRVGLLICGALLLGMAVPLTLVRGRQTLALLGAPIVLTFVAALLHRYPYLPARQDIYLTVPLCLLVGWGLAHALTHARLPSLLRLAAGLLWWSP
jgi:hypothetical protein